MGRQHKHKWEVRRTIWPYADGWGTYCPKCKTVLDTGLSKQEAERRCAVLGGAPAIAKAGGRDVAKAQL